MITKSIKLYLGDGFPVRIPVSQFDTMWRFVFSIIHNSQPWEIPAGASVVLNGRKPDGNVFAFSGTIENNTVTVDADVQMTAVAGAVVCELSILADSKTIGTANFTLDVEAAPKSPDDVSSESTLPAYGEILDRIEEMGGGGSVTVDDTLSSDSENPVQNKVITAALDGKMDDVQINGSSIVSAGIANIPKASASVFGVAKVYPYGDPPSRVVKLENSGNEVFSVPMLDASGHIRLSVLTEATTSTKGAMSASDKSKLDEIEAEANKTTVDSALSANSANPVQNSVVTNELNTKADKVTEVTVATDGAVTQTLEAGKWYHFTGNLTSLTVTLTTPESGELAQYHLDFTSGATAPTLTMPQTVTMPDGFSVEANKRYEIDILNNYGAVMAWAIS